MKSANSSFSPPPHLFFVNCAFKKPTSIKGGEEDFIPFHIDQRFVSHREDPHKYSGLGGANTTIMNSSTHYQTPRYGQYLTHALNHNTKTVATMESCFVLVSQHCIASTVSLTITDPASSTKASIKHSFKRRVHVHGSRWLETASSLYVEKLGLSP